jgi:hypothetical protein
LSFRDQPAHGRRARDDHEPRIAFINFGSVQNRVRFDLRVSNGALEGMNNKVKVISLRAYGYRTTWTYMANIYHCCAGLPQP